LSPKVERLAPPEIGNGVFILLPVLNEIANIGELLDRIEGSLNGIHFTVGILDDGSVDGTIEYIRARMERPGQRLHLICRKKTLRASQRGGALRTLMLWGLEHTSHEIFAEMDGDLSHRPEELCDGIRMLTEDRCDIAIASKYVPGSAVINRPWGRLMVSKICSYAVRSLLSAKVRDYSNGYRFYTRAAARMAACHAYRYGSPIYLSEILALWMHGGLRVGEFKTLYVGRNEGISKLRMADLVKAGVAIFEIAARYHFGGFRPVEYKAEASPAKRSHAGSNH
jgi:dolichol-phosphate mannosyltransferase